jgi:hypothetical protein
MRPRPNTPLIQIYNPNTKDNIKEVKKTNDSVLKNFSNFMKEIIENRNESSFLSGDKNVVKFVLSKYLNIPEDELSHIKKLSVIITNDYGLLNQFGNFLPELKLLKLNGSNILSFNDIGTSFNNIECLQMKNCHLKNLDGIICMQNLKILDIENNEVSDLLDIDMCTQLKKIVLKNNKISDSDNLTFLSSIANLEYVDLRNNPICNDNNVNIENFLSEITIVLWNDSHNILNQDVVGKFDEKIYNSPIRKHENKIDKEINNIIKDNESNNKKGNNPIIKKTKISIDVIEKPLSPNKNKKEHCLNEDNNNKLVKIIDDNKNEKNDNNNNNNNNINSFRNTLSKQTTKPVKFNSVINFFVDKSNGSNGSSTTGGSESNKKKPSSAFKIIEKDNKEIKSSFNKIKIKKIKK